MTDIEFMPYHKRHILFRLNTGVELSGVLVDSRREFNTDKNLYEFIATGNMIEYEKAENSGDIERMKSLKGEIDIDDIVWTQHYS